MAGNNLFRTVMFGGYNRQDVNEYIQSLEYEVEAGKKARQEEKLRREREEKERDFLLTCLYESEQAWREKGEKPELPQSAEFPLEWTGPV